MTDQTARLVDHLRDRLHDTTRRITWAELAFGTAVAAGTGAGTWLIATLLEASFWLGTTARTGLAVTLALLVVGLAATLLAQPLGRLLGLTSGPSDEEVARVVGDEFPHVSDRLVNLLQLADGKRSHAPAPFVDHAVKELAADLDDVSFDQVEDFSKAQRALRLASVPMVGILTFLLIAPSTFLGASERLLAPQTSFSPPAPFRLSVSPQDARLVRGDSLRIRATLSGEIPEEISLDIRHREESSGDRVTLIPDSLGTATHLVAPVRRSFRYRIEAPPVHTEWYTVTVEKRPLVRQLQLTVTPPSYTDLPAETLDPNVGDVSGLPGTTVDVSADAGGATVDSASLVFSSGRTRPLEVRDAALSGTFRLRADDAYALRLTSPTGTRNRNPIRYQVSVQADARPSVTFLSPEPTVDLEADLATQLQIQLSDDYGFSTAKLFYRMSEKRFGDPDSTFSSITLPLPRADQSRQKLVYNWLLAQDTDLDPQPGEVVLYYVQAWDNDRVSGPKSGRTATQRLRMPSTAEQYDDLDAIKKDANEQLDRLRERADSVRQQSRQLRQELRRTREADWQDRRQLEQIQSKQQSLQKGVEKLSEKVQEMNQQMQQNQLSSSEMSEKFKELRRVIDEINSPELRKALEKLKQAMQSNNQRQMQNALEQVQKQEASYQEQLERTLSLFKKLKAQQRLEELARRAGEMSERQKELRERTRKRMDESTDDSSAPDSMRQRGSEPSAQDSTARKSAADTPRRDTERPDTSPEDEAQRSAPSDSVSSEQENRSSTSPRTDQNKTSQRKRANEDLAREQSRAAEEMQKLMDKMNRSSEEMKDVQSAPQEQLKKLNRELERRNLPQQMRKNRRQLQENRLNKAQQGQKQMQQQLQQMQKRLSQMKSQMQGRQRQLNVAGLRNALENTLRLSKQQEDLRTRTENLATEGPTLRSYARDQMVLSEGLRKVTDSLSSIAQRVPEMSRKVQQLSGNALRAMETAKTALEKRSASKATGHQKTSMMHLNKLALLLSDVLEQLQNQQGSGSGMSMQQMIQQIQKMSGQQQKLNKQIQQHLNNVQGERLSKSQAERRRELARQQRQLKKQLEETNRQGEASDQLLGDLQKIAEQMERSAQQLEQGRHSRDLIKRQRQILTRLLNAQKSLRTQGKKQERRGREATDDFERQPPGQLPPSDAADQLRRDLIRALEMGYTSNYEELIKRYFQLLQNEEATPN